MVQKRQTLKKKLPSRIHYDVVMLAEYAVYEAATVVSAAVNKGEKGN